MDKVIATSEKAGKYLNVSHEIIMHGIDTKIYVPTIDKRSVRSELGLNEGKLVGCFGRVRYQKGIDILFKR